MIHISLFCKIIWCFTYKHVSSVLQKSFLDNFKSTAISKVSQNKIFHVVQECVRLDGLRWVMGGTGEVPLGLI